MKLKKATFIRFSLYMTFIMNTLFAQELSVNILISNAHNPSAELVLLKDDTKSIIEAQIIHPSNANLTLTENCIIEWKTSQGKIEPLNNKLKAFLTPDPQGTTAEIIFNLNGKIKSDGKNKTVNLSSKIKVISPVSYKKYYKNGEILGYKVGEYLDPKNEKELKKYNVTTNYHKLYPEKFQPPEFFFIVTEENKSLKITPHYTLGDYALNYPWFSMGMPQAIAMDFGLFQKLEALQELMNKDGYKFEKFEILYGFRPPIFNLGTIQSEGENTLKVPFSQHQFGKAIDILIDTDNDLKMDDLNKDGKIDMRDAAVILHYVNILDRQYRAEKNPKMGGAGLYSRHDFTGRTQTPYIHIDTRNFTTGKGNLIRWPNNWEDGSQIDHGNL